MNIPRVQKIYSLGTDVLIYDDSPSEQEKGFALVIADHMHSFQTVFVEKLDQLIPILRNKENKEEYIIEGSPHKSMISLVKEIVKMRPDHAKLTIDNRKLKFNRINDGEFETILISAGKANGPIELLIRSKNKVHHKNYTTDPYKNKKELMNSLVNMYRKK